MIIATLIFRSIYEPCTKGSWKQENDESWNRLFPAAKMGWDSWKSICKCSPGSQENSLQNDNPLYYPIGQRKLNSYMFSALALWPLHAAYICCSMLYCLCIYLVPYLQTSLLCFLFVLDSITLYLSLNPYSVSMSCNMVPPTHEQVEAWVKKVISKVTGYRGWVSRTTFSYLQ